MRYISSTILGLGMTFGLFFIMSTFIATGKSPITDNAITQIVDFVRIKQDETVRLKDRKMEKPDKPEAPPPAMPKPQLDPFKISTNLNTGFSVNPNINISADQFANSDGDYLPIVKVAPEYPRRALQRGIEGYVVVEFSVTKLGTVQNVSVIEADPKGYFERAAVKAAQKFKYKPKVINGEPVEVAGVRNKITFKIQGKK